VLLKPTETYTIRYNPTTRKIRIVSDSMKYRLGPGMWIYEIEPRGSAYWTGHPEGVATFENMRWREPLPTPLHGHFEVYAHNTAAFDELVRSQGYGIVCETITERSFPTMYRALLEEQARREIVPPLRSYYISSRYAPALSMMPGELHGEVARYIRALASPPRR
jgi:hypothetical protein